ncbi:MAG: hypothetical protein ACI308_00260 [Muribaculaceae bacterium]
MKHNILFVILAMVLVLTACDRKKSYPCQITFHLAADAKSDSISVFCYESDYNRSRTVFQGRIQDESLTLLENCNAPISRAAYFKCGDDTVSHHFVIERGSVNVWIKKDVVLIEGTHSNAALFNFKKTIRRIQADKVKIANDYLAVVADSTLTQQLERKYFYKDSVLSDSLQQVLVDFFNRGDAAARIAQQSYSPLLSKDSWNKLKH